MTVQTVQPLKKELNMDFDRAVARIEQLVVEHGFVHMMTKPIHQVVENKLGVKNYPRYTLILACGPELAKAALDVSKDNGLLFPCSFTVYEEDGKIWAGHISIMKISPVLGLAPAAAMAPVIEKTTKMVQAIWQKI